MPNDKTHQPTSKAKKLAITGAFITGASGVAMGVYSVMAGEATGGGALLAASALAFGLLAANLDRALQSLSGSSDSHSETELSEHIRQQIVALLPDDPPNMLSPSAEAAMSFFVNVSHVNGSVVLRAKNATEIDTDAEPLTDREKEVLKCVSEGHSNKIISVELGISERTVKNHLTATMTKLRASDRTHAVVTTVRLGWLEI